MQTFLPYANFTKSAQCLDNKRLGKQRVECKQILKALCTGQGWIHHPATKQWNGFEIALCIYATACCAEWRSRGFKDNLLGEFLSYYTISDVHTYRRPPWLGYEPYHASHRANLLRKHFNHYNRFGWTENPEMAYFWPSHHNWRIFNEQLPILCSDSQA